MTCDHVADVTPADPKTTDGCQECLEEGQEDWVELRVCVECGHVGCCASSEGAHARQHFEETGHEVITPLGDDEWLWCFEHETYD